jgi:hypothetical protein
MDDNLSPMGYQGEDGSRMRANSRRQPPWQSPDPGQADYGDGYDAHTPDDSYAGYDAYDHGHDGYGDDGFGQPDSYGGSGGYPAQQGGYGSGGYPVQQEPYGGSGGYPVQQGPYGGSGGYPALGYGAQAEDVAGRYAGNDWYSGRPAGASGSGAGFADTGAYNLDARTIEAYGSGPHPAVRESADPPGIVHTGQQERYDVDAYRSGPHPAVREVPDPPGIVHTGQQERYDGQYDTYADYKGRDAYQDRYGSDSTVPPAGKPSRTRKNPGNAKRGKRRLLIAVTAVVVAGILAAAGYVFVLKPKPTPVDSTSTGPLPSPGSSSAATAACVKQFGQYCHIELRTDDPAPLTLAELFPPAFVNETDHGSFTRAGTKLDTTCSNAVIGQDLVSALKDGNCTQVLRASYFSGDGKMMGTIGVANLSTTNEAHHAGKLVGTSDFVDPLTTKTGVTSKLGKGTGIVEAEYKGHYLIMIWAEFTSTNAPASNAQDQQLQQFGADLIAGTANISLSQRMLNGHPATAAAS